VWVILYIITKIRFLLYLAYFYLDSIYMIDIVEIQSFFLNDLIEKKMKKRMYNQTQKERRKEKKRQLIEKIKEERLKNSIILDNF
jgi:hypothetical protein